MASVKPPTLDRDAHGLWLTTGEWDAVYKTARAFGFTEASAFVRYCIWIVKQLEGAEAVKEAAMAATLILLDQFTELTTARREIRLMVDAARTSYSEALDERLEERQKKP